MKPSLQTFDLHDMLRCGRGLRTVTRDAATLEEAGRAVVRFLHSELVDPDTGARECALVRFYKTHSFGELPPALQRFARDQSGGIDCAPEMKCLVLMATAGELPEWNQRERSERHQAIPLPSAEMVEQAPMIAQLIRAMGLDVASVVAPHAGLSGPEEGRTYDVFYVAEAKGSPFIPAQHDFVERFGVRSVVGFGGILLTGELYAVILFSRVPVSETAAGRFRNIALDLKLAVSTLGTHHVFTPAGSTGSDV